MRYVESLRILSMIGQCYKKDFLVATATKGNHQGDNLENLKHKGYVLEREIIMLGSNSKKTISVVAITKQGRVKCSDLNNNNYYCEVNELVQKRFATGVPVELHKSLMQSRVYLMMHQAGVRAFVDEKPSLKSLLDKQKLYGGYDKDSQEEQALSHTPANVENLYQNNMSVNETLKHGVYYSMKEYRDYLNSVNQSNIESDITYCRARGIYIDENRTCVVYHTDAFKDKKIKINTTTESRAINNIKQQFTQLNHVNVVNVIVITNGRAIITDMGIAGKNGHHPHDAENKNIETASQWIHKNTTMFEKVYVFPYSVAGVKSLKYFSHHSTAEWRTDNYELADRLDGFTTIPAELNKSKVFFGRDKQTNNRMVFIPYFELKFLEQLRTFQDDISIITYKEMAETIAHILRRPNSIYDVSGEKLNTIQYQQNGYKVGVEPPAQQTKLRKKKITQVAFKVTEEEKIMIRLICNQRGISASRFIKSLAMPLIKEEYAKYEEYFKLEKEKRKLLEQAGKMPKAIK